MPCCASAKIWKLCFCFRQLHVIVWRLLLLVLKLPSVIITVFLSCFHFWWSNLDRRQGGSGRHFLIFQKIQRKCHRFFANEISTSNDLFKMPTVRTVLHNFMCCRTNSLWASPSRTNWLCMVWKSASRQWRRGNIAMLTTLPVLDCLNSEQHLHKCLEDRFLPQQGKRALLKTQSLQHIIYLPAVLRGNSLVGEPCVFCTKTLSAQRGKKPCSTTYEERKTKPRKEETKQHHTTEDWGNALLPNGGDGRQHHHTGETTQRGKKPGSTTQKERGNATPHRQKKRKRKKQ